MGQLKLVVAVSLFFISFSSFAQEYVPGEVIVKLKGQDGSGAVMGKAVARFSKTMSVQEEWRGLNMARFQLNKGQTVEQAVNDLKKDPEVLYAEPNYIFRKSGEVGLQQTFSAEEIQAAAVNSSGTTLATGAPIGVQSIWERSNAAPARKPVVAVLDSGLDLNHHVFQQSGALWVNPREIPGNKIDDDGNGYVDDVNGFNFVSNTGQMYDDDGHGTHCAGIILSMDQNIYGASLRPSKVLIMPLKFLDNAGAGSTSNAVRAIYYAVNNGATVLNNSWGGTAYSEALREAIAYAYSKGVLFVAAAGNAHNNNDVAPTYPASYDVPNVISIAATTDRDDLAPFSNFGASSVHLASPGVFILSTLPNNVFGTASGTSMAAPFVAGVAAQMKIESPNMLGFQLKSILMNQNTQVAALSGVVKTAGRLDAFQAVSYAMTAPVESAQPAFDLTAGREIAAATGGCSAAKSLQNGMNPLSAAAVVCFLLAQLAALILMRARAASKRATATEQE
jgi:subtilisin family serine protease